jgi:hypothetical protein
MAPLAQQPCSVRAATRSIACYRRELLLMAAGPFSSLAPFPALAGKRRSLQHPGGRSLPDPRQACGGEDDLGVDRHPLRLRPAGRFLNSERRASPLKPYSDCALGQASRRFGRFSSTWPPRAGFQRRNPLESDQGSGKRSHVVKAVYSVRPAPAVVRSKVSSGSGQGTRIP